jgi:hypothetical protein
MKMPCRITEEYVKNPWEGDQPDREPHLKALSDVTLDDLMSTNTYPWVTLSKEHGYLLELENDDSSDPFLREAGLNRAAMETLARFCRQFLRLYDKLEGV